MASKLGRTPHIKLLQDKDGKLYIYDQTSGKKQLISMRKNSNGTSTSRGTAADIEDLIWDFRYDHKGSPEKQSDSPEAE